MVPSGLPMSSLGPASTNGSPAGTTEASSAFSFSSGSMRVPASS
jgi:hypothetical protein